MGIPRPLPPRVYEESDPNPDEQLPKIRKMQKENLDELVKSPVYPSIPQGERIT
jgi:hypothetical protein